MKNKKIVVIGSANTDMVVKTDELPTHGETKLGEYFIMNSGGKGANQAVTVARLGGDLIFITKVGNDIFGEYTITGLRKEKIDTDFVLIDKNTPSGVALIMVDKEGENYIVVAPGANSKLSPNDVYQVKDTIAEAEIILIQLEIPIVTISAIIEIAKTTGQKVILNPAPAQRLDFDLLDGLFLITPNETEASLLTGIPVKEELTARKAAQIIHDKGVQNVIITLGAQGAYLHNGTTSRIIHGKKVKAIDTTAAGDVFNGAMAVAISEGMNLEDAAGFANSAAAIAVTRLGAQSSVPFRNEIL
jgi:ribokinase